ncbi:MAG: membrane protein insertion efficiency factor YidD, partial [Blastococcus sp.]
PVARVLLAALRFYQRAISPALPPRCRFYPSCSAYAVEAVERHGAARGTWLALRRLVKCAPWHPGGVDPVPEPRLHRGTADAAHSSTSVAPDAGDGATAAPGRSARRPEQALPPAASRTPQQEAGVA